MFWLNVLMRWLHLASAVIGVGGTIVLRFVVLPALESLPHGAETLQAIRPRFKRLAHSALGLLFVSGFYNYIVVAIPKVRDQGLEGYHPVMGVKILLSLALFVIAFLLLKPVASFHENRKTWLAVNTVLGLAVLALGAYLRRLW